MQSLKRALFCLMALMLFVVPCVAAEVPTGYIDESAIETRVLSLEEIVNGLQSEVATINQRLAKLEKGDVGTPKPVASSVANSDYGSSGTAVASTRSVPVGSYGTYSPPVASGGSTGTVQYAAYSAPVASTPVRTMTTRTRVRTQRQGVLGRIFNPPQTSMVQYGSSPVRTQTCYTDEFGNRICQ